MGPAARPMLPNDYKLAPPPTNSYQTDLALAAAANSMGRMPMVITVLCNPCMHSFIHSFIMFCRLASQDHVPAKLHNMQ